MNATDKEALRQMISDELSPLTEKLTLLDHAIRGNGKPGLNSRVAVLESMRGVSSKLWALLAGVVVAVLSSVATKLIG